MATTMLLLIVILLAITTLPWIDTMGRSESHHTDLMAGDEGEG